MLHRHACHFPGVLRITHERHAVIVLQCFAHGTAHVDINCLRSPLDESVNREFNGLFFIAQNLRHEMRFGWTAHGFGRRRQVFVRKTTAGEHFGRPNRLRTFG